MNKHQARKTITIMFCTIILVLLYPFFVQARTEIKMTFQIPIPGFSDQEISIDANSIGNYIKAIYTYLIGSVGIIATVVLMYAGFLWLTAMGNPGQITEAKAYISSSLTGMVIALASYVILYWVNPDLLNFKPLDITDIKTIQSNQKAQLDSYMQRMPCKNGNIVASTKSKNDQTVVTNCQKSCAISGVGVNSASSFSSDGSLYCCICEEPIGCCITFLNNKYFCDEPKSLTSCTLEKSDKPIDFIFDSCSKSPFCPSK